MTSYPRKYDVIFQENRRHIFPSESSGIVSTQKSICKMKKKVLMLMMSAVLFMSGKAHAQWTVYDPGNFAGNIANTVKEIATASKTVKNTLDGFKEVEKLYNDTKKYYDALKKVNNLIGDAYKVKECILMVGDISEIYVTSYKKMLSDRNFRPSELAAMASGYTKLLEQSGESLKELKSVAKSGVFSMNDHERMQAIDCIYTTLREYRSLVSYYTRKNISVSYVRAREKNGLASVKALYGNTASRCW